MMEKDPITQFLPQIYAFLYKYVCRRWYFICGKKSRVVRDVEEVGCSLLSGSRSRTLLSHPKLGFPPLPESLSSCLSPFHFDFSLGLMIINGWWWEILTELQVSDGNSRLPPYWLSCRLVMAIAGCCHWSLICWQFCQNMLKVSICSLWESIKNIWWECVITQYIFITKLELLFINCIDVPGMVIFFWQVYLLSFL